MIRLVPDRREAKDWPRITGAQGANHEVVYFGRILDHPDVGALTAGIAEFANGGGAAGEQALFVGRIDPSPCYHPRAVARADLVFIDIDQCIERRLIDEPLLD